MNQIDSVASTAAARFAFIGAGGIATTHAKALDAEVARVVAAADPNATSLEKFVAETDSVGHGSADELIAAVTAGSLEIDALVVCSPPSVRREVVQPALEAGLDVLVEKPLASTADEARALAALAEAHADRVTAVGYCHRFTPAVLEMKRRADAGDIGPLTRFENVFAFHHPGMAEAWFSDPTVSGGGSLIDTGCHSLDVFQFLVGQPKAEASVAHHAWSGRGDSSATALVSATGGPNDGVAGVILAGWLEPARFQIRLVGTEGSLFYDYEHAERLIRTGPDGATESIAVETHEVRFARQLEAFARAVTAGGPAADHGLATFADGLAVAEAVGSLCGAR